MAEQVICGSSIPINVKPYYLALSDALSQSEPLVEGRKRVVTRYFCLPVLLSPPTVTPATENSGLTDQIYYELSRYKDLPLPIDHMAALIQSVIEVESRFKTRAKSDEGAIGLMQLKPITALDLMLKMSDDELTQLGITKKDPIYRQLSRIRETDKKLRGCQKGEAGARIFKELSVALRSRMNAAKRAIVRRLYDKKLNLSLGTRNLVSLLNKYQRDGENARLATNVLYLALVSYSVGTYFVDRKLREGVPEENFANYGYGYANKVIAIYNSRIEMFAEK